MYMSFGERMDTSAISGLAITTEWGEVSRRRSVPSFSVTITGWPWVGTISKAHPVPATRQTPRAMRAPKKRRLINKRLLHLTAAVDFDASLHIAARGDRARRCHGEDTADIAVQGEGGATFGF